MHWVYSEEKKKDVKNIVDYNNLLIGDYIIYLFLILNIKHYFAQCLCCC